MTKKMRRIPQDSITIIGDLVYSEPGKSHRQTEYELLFIRSAKAVSVAVTPAAVLRVVAVGLLDYGRTQRRAAV
jgi:hypothetical protein